MPTELPPHNVSLLTLYLKLWQHRLAKWRRAWSRMLGARRSRAVLLDARELGYAIGLAPNFNVFAVDILSSFYSGFMIVCALNDLWRSGNVCAFVEKKDAVSRHKKAPDTRRERYRTLSQQRLRTEPRPVMSYCALIGA